jgi:dihydrolipoamide dehydrogenase
MVPPAMPKSLLVIGSGAIGIEFASFYRNLGAEVTVVEVMDRILPVEDAEISPSPKAFEKQGMKILTGAVTKPEEGRGQRHRDDRGRRQDAGPHRRPRDLAVGIVGNVENLGLEGTKVKVDRTHVVIDEWPHRRAGRLCHRRPGRAALAGAQGQPRGRDLRREDRRREGRASDEDVRTSRAAPTAMPQVASRRPDRSRGQGRGLRGQGRPLPLHRQRQGDRAGRAEGLVKTVFDAKTGELLGAHMIGAEVTELIQGYGIAKTLETTEAELMHTSSRIPTMNPCFRRTEKPFISRP